MTRNEHSANQALDDAVQQRAHVVRVLSPSKIVVRQASQQVAKKQHNKVLTMLSYAVLLCSSAAVGVLLSY